MSARTNKVTHSIDQLLKESQQRELQFAQARQRLVTAFISVRTLSEFSVIKMLGSGSNGMVLMCRVNNYAINTVNPQLVVAVKLLFNFGVRRLSSSSTTAVLILSLSLFLSLTLARSLALSVCDSVSIAIVDVLQFVFYNIHHHWYAG